MQNDDWQEIVGSLVDAKPCLANAWQVLDGTDGTAPGLSRRSTRLSRASTLCTRLSTATPYNEDVASPVEVQEFWEKHGSLPGVAVGT